MVKYIAIYFVVKIYFNIYNLLTIFHPIKVLIYNEMRVEVIDRTIIGVGDERGGCSTSKLFQILIRQCGLLKDSITHRKFIVSVKLLHTFEHFGGDGDSTLLYYIYLSLGFGNIDDRHSRPTR